MDSFSLAIANNKLFEKKDKFSENQKVSFLNHKRLGIENEKFSDLKIPQMLICEFCYLPLSNPVKLECGHVFCEKCAVLVYKKEISELLIFEDNLDKNKKEDDPSKIKTVEAHRDLEERFHGQILKEDQEILEMRKEKRKKAVLSGSCVTCGDKLNGIFNDVGKIMEFLEKAKKQKQGNADLLSKSKFFLFNLKFK